MDVENATKNLTESISESPFNTLFVNPIYASLLITCIVVLIIISIYEKGRMVKTGFYIFLTCLFVIFIHNKLLILCHRKQLTSQDELNVVAGIDEGPGMMGNNSVIGRGEYGYGTGLSYLNDI